MLETVLRDQCKLDVKKPVLAGVSGGADSLCLLGILHTAGYPVIVAHFNHELRPESELEAASVSELARSLNLPFVTDSGNVRSYARKHHLSLEEAARTLRYRFLFAAAREYGAQAVAVGHTADDQVETVLMHFLRGAGLAGLKGMEARLLLPVFDTGIPLVRPLLGSWRTDTESYCQEHGFQPHLDASNTDQAYFRNRLRHSLIPDLEKYNPRFKESLLRTVQALQGDYLALQEVLDPAWKDVVFATGAGWVAFDQSKLAGLSPGLRRNLIRRAGELLRPESRDFGFEALDRAAEFVEAPVGRQTNFVNNLDLFIESGKVYLAAFEADLPSAQWPQVNIEGSVINDQFDLGNGWRLTVEHGLAVPDPSTLLEADKWTVWIDADLMGVGLTVRPRREGDRFQPLGMDKGSIKLSDFFVNVKLPERARENWPLVCAGGQIVWIPGFRLAHPFRVTENTRRVVQFKLEKK